MGLVPMFLTWAWAHSAQYGPNPLGSTWPRVDLARYGFGLTRLDLGFGQLGSTWAQADFARLVPKSTRPGTKLTQLDMGPY